MEEKQKVDFKHFLEKFPEIELPITLGEESHHAFSQSNDPLPPFMIEQFIAPLEEDPIDELTEFVACFSIPATKKFHSIVYWKAGLLNYQYRLVNYDQKGNLVAEKVIAGTHADEDGIITHSVATINKDWLIIIVSGQTNADPQAAADATSSTANRWIIGTEGKIVNL